MWNWSWVVKYTCLKRDTPSTFSHIVSSFSLFWAGQRAHAVHEDVRNQVKNTSRRLEVTQLRDPPSSPQTHWIWHRAGLLGLIMFYTQSGGGGQHWCKQTRTWTLKLVKERVVTWAVAIHMHGLSHGCSAALSVPQGLRLSCNCHALSPVYHATCKHKTKQGL